MEPQAQPSDDAYLLIDTGRTKPDGSAVKLWLAPVDAPPIQK